MSFDESCGIRLISREVVEYHYIKLPSCRFYFETLSEDVSVCLLTYYLHKDKFSISFCLKEGKMSKTAAEITEISEYHTVIGNCELLTFSACGTAKSGLTGKVFEAARRSGSDILAVCQSDIGLSLCISKNTSRFEREVRNVMKNFRYEMKYN